MEDGIPALINEPSWADMAREAVTSTLGDGGLIQTPGGNMGAEDFSCFLEHIPGCYARLGARQEGGEVAPAHSSKFDFDEEAMAVGAAYMTTLTRIAGQRVHQGKI